MSNQHIVPNSPILKPISFKQSRKTLTHAIDPSLTEGISLGYCDSPISLASEGDCSKNIYSNVLFPTSDGLRSSSSYKKLPKSSLTPMKRKHSIASVDNIALIRLLQKENDQMKIEKEEIKAQLSLLSEVSKADRDEYIAYVEELEANNFKIEGKRKKYKEKSRKYKEKAKDMQAALEETQTEFEEYKTKFNIEDQRSLKDSIKTLKNNFRILSEENEKIKDQNKNLNEQLRDNIQNNENLKSTHSKLLKDIESFKNRVPGLEEDSSIQVNIKADLADLKQELEGAHEEINSLRAKQIEYISSIQLLKTKYSNNEEELRKRIRGLENEVLDKTQEIQELNMRLEEEISTARKFERKTITVQEEKNSEVLRLAKDLKEIANEKETIQQNYINYHRKIDRNKTSIDLAALTKAEASLSAQKAEIAKLSQSLKMNENKVIDLKNSNEKLLIENLKLKEHLNRINVSKFSDPAFSTLQERVKFLEEKNEDLEHQNAEEIEKLNENIKVLEKQLELVEKQKNDQMKKYEEKINSLMVESKLVVQRDRRSLIPGQFLNSLNEENWKQTVEMLNLKILELKNEKEKLIEEVNVTDSKYQKSKLVIAKKEIEKENLQNKFRDAQEQMREYCSQYTLLEVELYKINERFGKELNLNNQLENELQEMKELFYNLSNKGKKK